MRMLAREGREALAAACFRFLPDAGAARPRGLPPKGIFSPIHRANGLLPCGICCTLLPGRAPCERAQFTNIPGRMSRQTGAQPALHRPVGATFVGDNSQAEPLKRAAVPNWGTGP